MDYPLAERPDLEPPFLGREYLNPRRPAFDFQLADEGDGSPVGAEDDVELEDPPFPLRRVQREAAPRRFLIRTLGCGLCWVALLRN